MLVLTRKVGESFKIGHEITVTVVRFTGGGVRIGIEAPSGYTVVRAELLEREALVGQQERPVHPK